MSLDQWKAYREAMENAPRVWLVMNTEDGIVYNAYADERAARMEFNFRRRKGERRMRVTSYAITNPITQDGATASALATTEPEPDHGPRAFPEF